MHRNPSFLGVGTSRCSICLQLRSLLLLLLLLLLLVPSSSYAINSPCRQRPCTDNSLDSEFSREVGDSVTMRCRFAGLSQRSIESLQWFGPRSPSIPLTMGGTKFSQDSRLHLGRDTVGIYQEWSLTIDFLELTDAGEYKCAFNMDALQFVNRLNVTEPNLRIAYSGSPVEISVPRQLRWGTSVKFECWSYRAREEEIDLNWSRGLRQSKRLEFVTLPDGSRQNRIVCWFSLDNVTLTDGGNYTCFKTLMSDNRVLGSATAALGKVRLSSRVRQLLGPTLSANNKQPMPPPRPQQPPDYSLEKELWRKQQQRQQQQQQQQRLQSMTNRGTKNENDVLSDAGPPTTRDRQRPSAIDEPDFSYTESAGRRGRNSGSSVQSGKRLSALCLSAYLLLSRIGQSVINY